MKRYYYDGVLKLTSKVLNTCIRFKLWGWAKNLTNFRKKYLSPAMRIEVKKERH